MKNWQNPRASEIRSFEAIERVFSSHEYLLGGFFEENRARTSLAPDEMLRRTAQYSGGEVLLIKVALDIWSGSGDALVWELLETLDQQTFLNVVAGLTHIRGEKSTMDSIDKCNQTIIDELW